MTRIRTEKDAGKPHHLGTRSGGEEYYWTPYFRQCLDELHRGPPYKTGGPCQVKKTEYFCQPSQHLHLVGIGSPRRTYDGAFVPSLYTTSGYSATSPDSLFATANAQNSSMGAIGWSRYRPGNPTAGLGQFLGELRKIPTIPFKGWSGYRDRALMFKRAGNEYLNLSFGWAPFLRDLQQAIKTAWNINRHLDQLRRDNGKDVRRRGTISRTSTMTNWSGLDSMRPVLTSEFYPAGGTPTGYGTDETAIEHSFSAKFRYWIPDIDEPNWEGRAKRLLYGLNLTPKLVWELTPWSWLIDWETNLGHVINNLSSNAADNLVAKYAYVSTQLVRTVNFSVTRRIQTVYPTTEVFEVSASSGFRQTIYLRSAAIPFGFGLSYSGLSPSRMLILAALGLSRH